MTIGPASIANLGELVQIDSAAFSDPWPESFLAEELAHPDARILAARHTSGDLLGYASFRLLAGEAELLRVAVAPQVRRRGIARALIMAGLARLRAEGVARCHLEVRDGNAAAIRLYQGLGFQRIDLRRGYYADGTDALTFSLDLP